MVRSELLKVLTEVLDPLMKLQFREELQHALHLLQKELQLPQVLTKHILTGLVEARTLVN